MELRVIRDYFCYPTLVFKSRLALAAAFVLAWSAGAAAHDIPNDVTVQAFLKPSGQRLTLLVRAPLKAMLDVEFPKRGQGFLDIARAEPRLRDAAGIWIVDQIHVYEGDDRLPPPRIVGVQASLPSDRSFASYEEALAHISGPRLPDDTEVSWDQALIDAWLEYPIHSRSDVWASVW
jgi:hypothetical protein